MKQLNRPRSTFRPIIPFAILFAIFTFTGCGTFGNSKVVKQLQNENDRLLAEFRSQRDQNTQLTQRLNETQARLAESEKLLARLSPASSSRLSRLGNEPSTSFQSPSQPRSAQVNSNTRTDAASSSATAGNDAIGRPVDFQWRPMRKSDVPAKQ